MHICHHWVIWCYLLMRCRNWWPLPINQPVCDRTSDPIIFPWSIVKSTLVIGEFVEILGVDGWMKSVLTFLLSVWIQVETVVPCGTVQIPIFDDPRPSHIDSLAISLARHWPSGRDRAGAWGRRQLLQQRRLAAQFALGTLGLLSKKLGTTIGAVNIDMGNVPVKDHFLGFPHLWCGFVFFPFVYFVYFMFYPFPLLFAAFWSWKLPFQRYFATLLNLNLSFILIFIVFATLWCFLQHFGARSCHFNGICSFEPLIFDGICNMLVLELFM